MHALWTELRPHVPPGVEEAWGRAPPEHAWIHIMGEAADPGNPFESHISHGVRELLPRHESRSGQLPPETEEQRLERKQRGELQLLGVAPGGADELASALGALEPLAGGV